MCLIDPADETEVPGPTPSQIDQWYSNYKAIKYGDPLPDKDPSPDQIAAMHLRIVTLGMEPYADFSLLTPYGRRMAKILRHRSWVLQEDGTYRPLEVPGPDSFNSWDACFKVYEVILLMLRFPVQDGAPSSPVVTPIALETYHEGFMALARSHPECWHLCQKAEDRCRAEHFPRLVRSLQTKLGRTPSWSEVFVEAAGDDRYWDREVRRPALAFIARGKRPFSLTDASEAAAVAHVPGRSAGKARGSHHKAFPDNNKDSKKGRGKERGGKAKSNQQPPAKDRKGRFTTTREGVEICYKYACGERGTCEAPCPRGRAHVCQKCLQPHTNSHCTKSS